MNTAPDHPDFTALALGEHVLGAPSQAVTDALRTSVSARREADQIRDTARRLSLVLKGQPVTRLDAARRNAIFHADPEKIRARFAAEEAAAAAGAPVLLPDPEPRRRRRTWIFPAAAAAVIAVAGVITAKLLPAPAVDAPQVVNSKATPSGNAEGQVSISMAGQQSPPQRQRPAAPPPQVVKMPSAPSLLPPPSAPLQSVPVPPVIAVQPATPALPPQQPGAQVPVKTQPETEPLGDFATPEKRRDRPRR